MEGAHFGASIASWLIKKCSFWSLERLMAQDADQPGPFQILQMLYKSFIKLSMTNNYYCNNNLLLVLPDPKNVQLRCQCSIN